MRVCHLGKYYPPAPGGIETHVRTLARAQAELGLDVQVFCIRHDAGPDQGETDGAVHVRRFRRAVSCFKLDLCPGLARAIAREPADLFHMQVPNPTMILAVLRARPRVPVVVTYQSDLVAQRLTAAIFRPFERAFFRRVRAILATSPPYAESSHFLAAYREKVRIVPMGIELEPYLHPSEDDVVAAEKLKNRFGGPLWVACSRLAYYKGLHTAVRALRHVRGTLVIVGDGPERARLEGEAREAGVTERVHFAGAMPYREAIPYYLAAHALWFPSNARSEAFGLTQVEAMACGCPVINTAIAGSGAPWVSPHETTGLTVPIEDPEALAAAAQRLLDEAGLRERLGAAARQRVQAEFDHRVMAQRCIEVYEQVLAA